MGMSLPRRPLEITDPAAKRYWDKHAATLWDCGTMTVRDVESFVCLCQIWGKLQQLAKLDTGPANYRGMVQYNNLLKQYEKYAATFGLFGPKGRTASEEPTDIGAVVRKAMGQ